MKEEVVMAKNDVTINQVNEVRRLAMSKGITRVQFQEALDCGRLSKFVESLDPFRPWHILTVKPSRYGGDIREALDAASERYGLKHDNAIDAQRRFDFLKLLCSYDIPEHVASFVLISNKDLGLPEGATKQEVEDAGLEFGLVKCMPYDAVVINEYCLPRGISYEACMMMDRINIGNIDYGFFVVSGKWVRRDDTIGKTGGTISKTFSVKLGSCRFPPEATWHYHDNWIFRRKASALKL